MSGGSMDYACWKVSNIAEMEEDPIIKNLLKDLSDYLHAEEWCRSGDTGKESYEKARKTFKEKWLDTPIDLKPYVDKELSDFMEKIYGLIGVEEE